MKPADTTAISLNLASKFSMYRAHFNSLPDGVVKNDSIMTWPDTPRAGSPSRAFPYAHRMTRERSHI